MNIHQARDLAIKLFGLYCVIHFVLRAPQIVSLVMLSPEDAFLSSKLVFAITSSIVALLYLTMGWVLLFRTRSVVHLLWRAETESNSVPDFSVSHLSFWIILIGVFYFIRSVSGLAAQLWIIGTEDRVFRTSWVPEPEQFMLNLVIFLLSLLCIFKAHTIEGFIMKKAHPVNTCPPQ